MYFDNNSGRDREAYPEDAVEANQVRTPQHTRRVLRFVKSKEKNRAFYYRDEKRSQILHLSIA